MKKGSITPFCAVSLAIVASLLLALLESARVHGLQCYAGWKSDAVIDSVCAEYQPVLWEQYGLLFLDGAYGTKNFSAAYLLEQMDTYMEKSCENRADLFSLNKGEVLLEGYALATDEEGELFLTYVAEREKENLPMSVAWNSYLEYQRRSEAEWQYGGVKESITKAQHVINEVKEEWIKRWEIDKEVDEEEIKKGEEEDAESQVEPPDTSGLENVLDSASSMMSAGILDMIYADVSGIATGDSKPESELESRKKPNGNMHLNMADEWYRQMLVLSYLEKYFSNCVCPIEEHYLTYEMEYLLCGKDTEWENLAGTLEKLLMVREACNVAYLLQDEEKMDVIEGAAGLIGWMAGENPAVVEVVKIGLVGAWAYAESILDVRSLVAGEVIPLVKRDLEWTTSFGGMFGFLDNSAKAKPCDNGLSYVDYLKQLLFLMEKQTLAYRMMEVLEMSMTSQEVYANSRMDHMLVMLRCKLVFESRPLFSSLISDGNVYRGNYYFTKNVERSYVP